MSKISTMDPRDTLGPQECSFCGAIPEDVERLFVAESASICDRCIRSLAAEEAVTLEMDPGSVERLVGRWTRRSGEKVSVSLQFERNGILRSTTVDGAIVTNKVLRYSFNGSELSTVELIACGEQETAILNVSGEVLTLHSKGGESVFKRDEPEV